MFLFSRFLNTPPPKSSACPAMVSRIASINAGSPMRAFFAVLANQSDLKLASPASLACLSVAPSPTDSVLWYELDADAEWTQRGRALITFRVCGTKEAAFESILTVVDVNRPRALFLLKSLRTQHLASHLAGG